MREGSSPTTCHMASVTCMVSRVMCHESGVTVVVCVFLDKVAELVDGGSVINGVYPVKFIYRISPLGQIGLIFAMFDCLSVCPFVCPCHRKTPTSGFKKKVTFLNVLCLQVLVSYSYTAWRSWQGWG